MKLRIGNMKSGFTRGAFLGVALAGMFSLSGVVSTSASASDGPPSEIKGYVSGLCLGANQVDANAYGNNCNRSDNQTWILRNVGSFSGHDIVKFVNRANTGWCLDNGGKGDLVYVSYCQSGNGYQEWVVDYIKENGKIVRQAYWNYAVSANGLGAYLWIKWDGTVHAPLQLEDHPNENIVTPR